MTTLHIQGNVNFVIDGNVSHENLKKVPLDAFHFALGSGSYDDPIHLGETIVISKKPFVSWMGNDAFHTKSAISLKSPFLMGISEEKPEKMWRNETPVMMETLYQNLCQKYPIGFALFGVGKFSEFHSTHLKKAPIYHENVNEKSKDYWADLPIQKEKSVCFFGVVIGEEGKKKFSKKLDLGFYQNPGEGKASDLLSHTHAAILKKDGDLGSIEVVHHALTKTVLASVSLSLFPIAQMRSYTNRKK